jgi:hypothetical protein
VSESDNWGCDKDSGMMRDRRAMYEGLFDIVQNAKECQPPLVSAVTDVAARLRTCRLNLILRKILHLPARERKPRIYCVGKWCGVE